MTTASKTLSTLQQCDVMFCLTVLLVCLAGKGSESGLMNSLRVSGW